MGGIFEFSVEVFFFWLRVMSVCVDVQRLRNLKIGHKKYELSVKEKQHTTLSLSFSLFSLFFVDVNDRKEVRLPV